MKEAIHVLLFFVSEVRHFSGNLDFLLQLCVWQSFSAVRFFPRDDFLVPSMMKSSSSSRAGDAEVAWSLTPR